MTRTIYLWSLAAILIFGCKEAEKPKEVEEQAPPVPSGPPPDFAVGSSDYLFNEDSLYTFELTIHPDSLAKIDIDPAAEEYVEASLTFQGETLNKVGVRYKGSIGAFVNCLSGQDWANPSGHKICTKLSMKVKVDWKGSDTLFYGMEKLQFHSMNYDSSKMHERLGYHLFREMGIPSPRVVHVRVMVNGQYSGLYALVEQIDKFFIRHNYEDKGGNLYKEIWPLDQSGRAQKPATYAEKLETNKKKGDVTIMESFGKELASARTNTLKDVISNRMNIDEIMSFIAVDRTIRADDGPFHWYCFAGYCSNHNYYWYEKPTTETLHLLPWDLDMAFENIIDDINPVTPVADKWGQISAECEPFPYGPWQVPQRSSACDKLTSGWIRFRDEYKVKLDEFMNGPFAEDKVDELIDRWAAQIQAANIEANELHDDAIELNAWKGAIETLRQRMNHARSEYQKSVM